MPAVSQLLLFTLTDEREQDCERIALWASVFLEKLTHFILTEKHKYLKEPKTLLPATIWSFFFFVCLFPSRFFRIWSIWLQWSTVCLKACLRAVVLCGTTTVNEQSGWLYQRVGLGNISRVWDASSCFLWCLGETVSISWHRWRYIRPDAL